MKHLGPVLYNEQPNVLHCMVLVHIPSGKFQYLPF
jgi:hypothetical protein